MPTAKPTQLKSSADSGLVRPLRRWPLIALLITFLILAALHSFATPPFEAPDEVWHYAYVRWIAEGNGLPPLTDDRSGAYQEVAQPPLYYLLAAAISRHFPDGDLDTLLWHNPRFGYQAPGTTADNKNMLIHPWSSLWPQTDAALSVHATRATSWLFGLTTVVATWALCSEVFQNRWSALTGAALVAFQPQFVFLSGVINNDSAAAALATIGLWLGIRFLRRGTTRRSAVLAGLVAGLGMLTKTSLLPLIAYLAACLALATPASRSTRADARRAGWPRLAARLALFLLTAALTGGWWYLRNLLEVGDLLGLSQHTGTPWGRPEPISLVQLLPELPLLLRSFWGAYGWGHVTWPAPIYLVLGVSTTLLLILAIVNLVGRWRRALKAGHLLRPPSQQSLELLAGTLALVWVVGIAAALLRWMLLVEAPHGRLLFPALGAWALLVALGLQTLDRLGQRATGVSTRAARSGLLAASFCVTALAPGARILATFAPPRLRPVEQVVAACDHPQDLSYGEQARLVCATVDRGRVEPGNRLTVEACWAALAPMVEDYTVFVQVIGPENTRVGERHTYPGLGRYPTSLWETGQAFCDRYTFTTEPWADTPLAYRLEIGLFDAATGERLPVLRGTEQAEPPVVASVVLASSEQTAPEPELPLSARFGPTPDAPLFTLLGVTAPITATAGTTVPVTLHWEAVARTDASYVAFVHLWEPGDTVPLAQHDAPPRQGWYQTHLWQPGEVIADTHPLQIPDDLPPGRYPLWGGLYRREDGTRLSAYGPDGRFRHDLVPLGSVEIR